MAGSPSLIIILMTSDSFEKKQLRLHFLGEKRYKIESKLNLNLKNWLTLTFSK